MKDKYEAGYWWVVYKDGNNPYVVELAFRTWDHTRDGDAWIIYDGDEVVEENLFYKYRFIERIKEPEWPY